jgi:uncharacterized phage protein (TIGR01671 family)
MREIKYRARRKDGTLIGLERFDKAHWQCTSIEDFNRGVETWILGTFASAIKEQFTGLRDKRGVEICEGDLVRRELRPGQELNEVAWTFGGFYLRNIANDAASISFHLIKEVELEVIGDIHENPELLAPEAKQ